MQIEQWCERYYPSFVILGQGSGASFDPNDARTRILNHETEIESAILKRKRAEGLKIDARELAAAQGEISKTELFLYAGSIFGVLAAVTFGALWVLIRIYGSG